MLACAHTDVCIQNPGCGSPPYGVNMPAHFHTRGLAMAYAAGRHFLQIPGPTNVPDRILRAIDHATIDHRGPEFQRLGQEVLEGLKAVFKTQNPVIIFPASGTGAWE